MNVYTEAFKTLDEDNPKYGVIYPDGVIKYFEDEDTAWWVANDENAKLVDEEAMNRP